MAQKVKQLLKLTISSTPFKEVPRYGGQEGIIHYDGVSMRRYACFFCFTFSIKISESWRISECSSDNKKPFLDEHIPTGRLKYFTRIWKNITTRLQNSLAIYTNSKIPSTTSINKSKGSGVFAEKGLEEMLEKEAIAPAES